MNSLKVEQFALHSDAFDRSGDRPDGAHDGRTAHLEGLVRLLWTPVVVDTAARDTGSVDSWALVFAVE